MKAWSLADWCDELHVKPSECGSGDPHTMAHRAWQCCPGSQMKKRDLEGDGTWPRSHSQEVAELGFHPTRDRSGKGRKSFLKIKEVPTTSGGARAEAVLGRT